MSENGFNARDNGVFEITGQVTFQTVPQFLSYAVQWLKNPAKTVTIDMRNITLADSAGLALMLEWAQQAAAAQRELTFINIPEQVQELIRVNGLQQVFPTH